MPSEQQIARTVAWWTNALRAPKTDVAASMPGSPQAGNVETLLDLAREVTPLPEETNIGRFSQELARLLRESPSGYTARDGANYDARPYTDFRPVGILKDALDLADIGARQIARLPWKTHTFFEGDDVYIHEPGKARLKLE